MRTEHQNISRFLVAICMLAIAAFAFTHITAVIPGFKAIAHSTCLSERSNLQSRETQLIIAYDDLRKFLDSGLSGYIAAAVSAPALVTGLTASGAIIGGAALGTTAGAAGGGIAGAVAAATIAYYVEIENKKQAQADAQAAVRAAQEALDLCEKLTSSGEIYTVDCPRHGFMSVNDYDTYMRLVGRHSRGRCRQ